MNKQSYFTAYMTVSLMLAPQLALAYVGPGTGLSAIGSFLAFLMTLILVVVGFFWLPLKRVLKSRQKKSEQLPEDTETEGELAQAPEMNEATEDSPKL